MKYRWWLFQVIMTLVSGFFLVFGVELFMGAYSLKGSFQLHYDIFAASFVILISLTLMITFLIKMIRVYRHMNHQTNSDAS